MADTVVLMTMPATFANALTCAGLRGAGAGVCCPEPRAVRGQRQASGARAGKPLCSCAPALYSLGQGVMQGAFVTHGNVNVAGRQSACQVTFKRHNTPHRPCLVQVRASCQMRVHVGCPSGQNPPFPRLPNSACVLSHQAGLKAACVAPALQVCTYLADVTR